MKKILILLVVLCSVANAQIEEVKSFFKYSTFYISSSMSSSTLEDGMYKIEDKVLLDITEVNPFDYNYTIGLRKVARFDYEYKVKTFYDGSESQIANKAPIGNAKGFEYLANISLVRDRGNEFINQDYFLRYLSDSYLIKGQFVDNQKFDLKYMLSDVRWRKTMGNFDFSVGAAFRMHPVYGYLPINDFWDPAVTPFSEIAEDFGYVSEQWSQAGYVNYDWYDVSSGDSIQVAHTTGEFMRYHFGNAIDDYNDSELRKLGLQKELSAVLGVAYYKWYSNWWLHGWMNVLPYHVGLDNYSFDYSDSQWKGESIPATVEWDAGLVFGVKFSKNLGLFLEGTHQRFWMRPVYEFKVGINYLFL
tara:strand:- start:25843 stop:26922 length:1080 start_codon:yes stop_codon:yes gene_type:complete